MTLILDIVDGATVRQTAAGVEAIRRARITGAKGPATERARLAFETPGLPRYGDAHPSIAGLRVVDINLEAVDTEQWEATITYRVPDPNELATMEPAGTVIDREWFSTTITEEIVQDINGGRLYHWYAGNPLTPLIIGSGIKWARSASPQFVWKNESAEVQRPSVGARVVITSAASLKAFIALGGTINGGWWSGYPPRTWLIGGVQSRWERTRWVNTWELLYNPDTWRFRSVVEYFGAPPDDAIEGNGIALFDVYRDENFNRLGFEL